MMRGGHDGEHRVGSGHGDQACSGAQRGVSGHYSGARLAQRAGYNERVTIQTFVRIDRANKWKLRKFLRLAPAQRSVADFLDEQGRRADVRDFEPANSDRVARDQQTWLWRGEGYRFVRV